MPGVTEDLQDLQDRLNFAESTLKAILARIDGVWDDPDLMAKGMLHVKTEDDIARFAVEALDYIKEDED